LGGNQGGRGGNAGQGGSAGSGAKAGNGTAGQGGRGGQGGSGAKAGNGPGGSNTGGAGGKGGNAGSGTGGATVVSLVGVDLTPSVATLAVGTSVTFTATARYSDSSKADVTSTATWSSSATDVAANSVGGAATFKGLKAGMATISATLPGAAGPIAGQATITVNAVTLQTLTVTPIAPSIPVKSTLAFSATGVFSDQSKQDLTTQVQWSSGDPTVLTISNTAPTIGTATGVAAGSTTVSATFGTVTGQTTATVTPATLTTLEISPSTASLAAGLTQTFTATGIYSDGTNVDVTKRVTWSSSDTTILSFATAAGSEGLAQALKPGAATVTATLDAQMATADVTVKAANLVSIAVSPATASLPKGTTQAFKAQGSYTDGSTLDITASVTWSATDATIASVSNASGSEGVATGVGLGATNVVASLSGVSGQSALTVTAATVTSLAITPTTATLPLGRTQGFKATATYTDLTTQDVTASATWSSSDTTVAGVSSDVANPGLVTALKVGGPVTITATFGGSMATAQATVSAAALDSIAVAPAAPSIVAGTLQAFTATGTYSDGSTLDLTQQVTWSSSANNVATIANAAGARGIATGIAAGTASIRAALGGVTGMTTLTVTAATVTGLSISPITPSLHLGQMTNFTATAILSNGAGRNVTGQAMWRSSAPAVATINNGGFARCVTVGTTTISATNGAFSASTTLTCTQAVVTELQISPVLASIFVGQVQTYTVLLVYSDGTTMNVGGNQLTWASSNTAVATVSSGGFGPGGGGPGGGGPRATGVSAGSTTITATYQGFTATSTLNVSVAVLSSVSVTPALVTLAAGQQQQMTATGIYSDGSTRNLTGNATWTSSADAVASVSNAGGRGLLTGLTAGSATITATVMGISGTAGVTVSDAQLMQVQVTPALATLPVGLQQAYTAIGVYGDLTTRNLTSQVVWTTGDGTVASVSNATASKGVLTSLKAGTTTVVATFGSTVGSTTLTVTNATVSQIQLSPPSVSQPVGLSTAFKAIAVMSDLSTLDITALATWTSSDPTVVTVSTATGSKGVATTLKAGTATISAGFGGASGTASYTVGAQQLVSLAVTPGTSSVTASGNVQLKATGTYDDNSTVDLTNYVTWLSSPAGIVTVSNAPGSQGLVTGMSMGTATVEANFKGQKGSAQVMVTP
jgi:uncharacterized protein YjdB